MKRSEMLWLMLDFFDNEFPSNEEVGNIDLNDMDQLLLKMEEAGMLPPFIKHPLIPADMSRIQHASRKAVERAHNYQHLPDDFEINVWEDENEEN